MNDNVMERIAEATERIAKSLATLVSLAERWASDLWGRADFDRSEVERADAERLDKRLESERKSGGS